MVPGTKVGSGNMNHGFSAGLKAQKGFSLLNIMIALVVSAASSLASISLYTNHQAATKSVKEAATVNRRIATSMVVLQKEVTAAGFGIAEADTDDVVVLEVPETATTAAEISLLWRYREEDGSVKCRGVHEHASTIDDDSYRVLRIVESRSDCDTTANLVDLLWDTEIGILSQWEVRNGLADYITANGTLFDFQITPASCAPFGMVRKGNRLQATISSPNLAQLNGVMVSGNQSRICLVNTINI